MAMNREKSLPVIVGLVFAFVALSLVFLTHRFLSEEIGPVPSRYSLWGVEKLVIGFVFTAFAYHEVPKLAMNLINLKRPSSRPFMKLRDVGTLLVTFLGSAAVYVLIVRIYDFK